MNLTFSEIAVAIGLLTPLILGILSFVDKRFPGNKQAAEEKKAEEAKSEPVTQGLTVGVDFAAELVSELRRDNADLEARLARAEAERDAYKRITQPERNVQ